MTREISSIYDMNFATDKCKTSCLSFRGHEVGLFSIPYEEKLEQTDVMDGKSWISIYCYVVTVYISFLHHTAPSEHTQNLEISLPNNQLIDLQTMSVIATKTYPML